MGITQQGQVTILIRCSSRGFGHQVCSDYLRVAEIALRKYGFTLPDEELACFPCDSDEGQDYLAAMNCALNFAWCNRHMEIEDKVMKMTQDNASILSAQSAITNRQ